MVWWINSATGGCHHFAACTVLVQKSPIRRALEVINTQSQLSAGLMEVKLLCLVEQDSLDEAGKLLQGNTVLSSCQHQS